MPTLQVKPRLRSRLVMVLIRSSVAPRVARTVARDCGSSLTLSTRNVAAMDSGASMACGSAPAGVASDEAA
ncbi:MAG: hypothetical protein DI597_20290, partial [Pseudoxanthomonas spadix]